MIRVLLKAVLPTPAEMTYYVFQAKLFASKLLPTRLERLYWEQRCPVCGVEREWHEYGLVPGTVYIDGMGPTPCEHVREG